ncbi:hypothetical protein AVEN_84959-1 [Araneus ventricosus]|uniref:Mos1 transposase HTH domain-containing protein n=1 Tax=Araneus ventricosus TaxID=182803 RepID=A0A4Y2BZL7_ARAVE|nr:hypothetical protein AVEN_84959-1 [Araneus ventricosus]
MRLTFRACALSICICWLASDDITEEFDRIQVCEYLKCLSQLKIAVIRFLNAKDVKAAEINRQISEVHEENIMSEGRVRKWIREFKDARTNMHDEEKSGRSSVITEDLVQKVGEVRENRHFTISSLSNEFPQVSRSVLYGIVTEH